MKKIFYSSLMASMLFAACSQEEVGPPSSTADGNYTITVNLPEEMMGTRALGDGLTATNLSVYLYDAENNKFLGDQTANFASTSLSTTVTLNLVNGKSYYVAFFAQSPNAQTNNVYTVDTATGQITVDYTKMTEYNTDDYDCFFQVLTTGVIGNESQSAAVTLYRPLCQINWGTNDLTDGAVQEVYGTNAEYLQSSVKITAAYNTFNMLAKDEEQNIVGDVVTTSTTEVNLPALPPPSEETFPVTGYSYISAQYLLAPRASSTYDLALTITNNGGTNTSGTLTHTVNVSTAPIQANYRTNIYGSLLTNQYNVTVTKDPTWYSPDYTVSLVWDGTTVTYPTVSDDSDEVMINRASDLAGLADMVNGNNDQEKNDFAGKTIVLAADFDMNSNEFEGLGTGTRSSSTVSGNSFKGTFDGNGHTISNVVIKGSGEADEVVGFIPNLDGENAEVKDVTFEGITINAPAAEQAGVIGTVTNGAQVSNVVVNSGTITAKQGAGGIVGRMILDGTISQCENHATVTVTGNNAGGIVGAAYYSSGDKVSMTISNCTNYGNVSGTSESSVCVGGIVGISAADVVSCSNNGTVNGTQNSVGGIVGCQQSAGSVKGCTNNAAVTATNSTLGAGGIVGWVKYQSSGYTYQEMIEVSGNTNNGVITGNNGVGGIVGEWYQAGTCTGNFNYAPQLIVTKSGFVAGIVGSSQFIGEVPTFTDGSTAMLTVSNNVSTTTLDNMIGGTLKDLYVYANNKERVTQSDNSNVKPGTAD